VCWQKHKPDLFAEETSAIRRRFSDVAINELAGRIVLEGSFSVIRDGTLLRCYRLRVEFPTIYPDWIPDVFMLEPGVKYVAERHIEANGRGCLCLPHEFLRYFPNGVRFNLYFDRLVAPWLVGQAFYDEHGRWPFQCRDHGKNGVLEGLAEMLDIADLRVVERFARVLVRKKAARDSELCPCGSGRKLRDCHFELYHKCRSMLPGRAMRLYRKKFF